MAPRSWKKIQPNSLRHAMELCLEHARVKRNLSVDRIADNMGLASKWTLYKWLENGRMPAILIRPFEHACGIEFMTQYLATSGHKLVIAIPAGRKANSTDVNELQGTFSEAMAHLIRFYQGKSEAEETLGSLTQIMSDIAWHRENVSKTLTPELALFDDS